MHFRSGIPLDQLRKLEVVVLAVEGGDRMAHQAKESCAKAGRLRERPELV